MRTLTKKNLLVPLVVVALLAATATAHALTDAEFRSYIDDINRKAAELQRQKKETATSPSTGSTNSPQTSSG